VADLDGDGRAEVLRAEGAAVYALDGAGMPLQGWPWLAPPDALGRARPINADPSVTDLDGDGRREIVVVESGYEPRLFALDAAGVLMTPFPLRLAQVVDRQTPSTIDLDRDGRSEIVQATLPYMGDLFALSPPSSLERIASLARPTLDAPAPQPEPMPLVPAALLALRLDGSAAPGWPQLLGDGAAGGAVVADLDGDGRLDLLRISGFLESGLASLRVIGLQVPGGDPRGYPFTVDGVLPSSEAVAIDLNGDRVPEVAVLASEGTYGGWRLLVWDVGSGRRR
jgi:hypothetical protein